MNVPRTKVARTKASLLRLSIVVAILALLVPLASGQTTAERTAFDTISTYLTESGADSIERRLEEVGFTAPMSNERWRQLPAVSKIETAWHAAESAKKGSGQDLLALLSRRLAQTYDAVGHEPTLTTYLAQPPPKSLHFSYVTTPPPKLSPDVEHVIQVLSGYADGGAFGSAHDVMVRYFGKSPDEAYQVLRTSKSTNDAIEKVWAELTPDKQQAALKKLAADVMTAYPAAQHESSLKPYRALVRAPVAPLGPAPRTEQKSSMAKASSSTKPTERYAQHIAESAKPGAGGVVFAGAVTADSTLRKISWLAYNPQSQSLVAQLQGGRQAEFGPVELDSVMLAHSIFSGPDANPPSGDPFIFLGLTAPVEESECLPKLRKIRTAALRYKVIARPLIADSHLGWAMMRLDAYPAHSESLARDVEMAGNALAASRIRSLFNCPHAASWTITDVPISVAVQDDRIVLRRANASHELSERLRSSAFLAMSVEVKADGKCALSEQFVRELPLLMRTSEDYRLLNQFAEVFAIVKLAKEHGALLELPPYRPAGAPLPSAVRISDQGVEPIADYSVDVERKQEASRSTSCWAVLEPPQP